MSGRKQFDVDEAVDKAMRAFWERGYAETSLDVLSTATGLGRGSLYGAFGDKDALFRKALDRYSEIHGGHADGALAAHPDAPLRAIEAFFQVTLDRIADPGSPVGCLIAQSVVQSPGLSPESRRKVDTLLARQFERLRAVLRSGGVEGKALDDLTTFAVAVNQSLAVLSRAGRPDSDLQAVVRVACGTIATALADRAPADFFPG